jgi:hypothetical protein
MRAYKHNNERRTPFFIIAPLLPQAVYDGQDSLLLGAIHIAMLRLVQADMEESHASGAALVGAVCTCVCVLMCGRMMSPLVCIVRWRWIQIKTITLNSAFYCLTQALKSVPGTAACTHT